MTDDDESDETAMTETAVEMQQLREGRPSAWMALVGNQTIPLVVDALLDAPPGREFNKTELAEYAGTTPQSIQNHMDNLLEFQMVEAVPDTQPTRYRLDTNSPVITELFQLTAELDRVAASDEKLEDDRGDAASDPATLQPDFPSPMQPNKFEP
jgi:hypothetical protein